MNISMQILFLISFVYSLKADEDPNLDESKTSLEDYSSIELAVTPKDAKDGTTEKKNKLDQDDGKIRIDDILNSDELNMYNTENIVTRRFTAYLKDPSSDEVYKAAKISIQFKDSSSEQKIEKENKKAVENTKYTDAAGTSRSLKHKNVTETNNTDSNERNRTLNEKDDRSSIPESKKFNEKSKNITENEDNQKSDSETVDKSIKTVLEKPTTKRSTTPKPTTKSSTIDDMDDLIFPGELEKSRKSYDDDDYNRSLYPETHIASDERGGLDISKSSELDGLDHEFRPSRRMFDSVPVLDNEGRSDSDELLESINTPRSSWGGGSIPSNIFAQNRPESIPYRLKNIRLHPNYYERPNPSFFDDPNYGFHFPSRPPMVQSNERTLHGSSQEILINPNKFENSDEIENDPIRFGNSREMLSINSRETIFGPSKFNNAEESKPNFPNRFDISREMAQEFPNILGPNRSGQPPTMYNLPNRLIPHVTTIPNRWIQAPRIQNIPIGWVHPRTLNIPNGFNPTITEPRIIQSQETYDLLGFETNAIRTEEYNPLDSNAYPYVSAKRDKIAESNMNPIFRKLAQASNLPHLQLPIYGILRYPGYAPFDPRLITQRNVALVPRSRRFSIGNGFQFNRMCCY